jgi:LmbE family N-acetylglucosaminyl deacetylase
MDGSSGMVIEQAATGRPHEGKVLAAVFPHSDDFSIFAGGTIAKLLKEGYAGYLIRITNDEMDSWDLSLGETVFRIEGETRAMAAILGLRKVYDFNYKNHYLEHSGIVEIRHRLIALFRFLKVDAVISFDPWGHYEENPDHSVTAMAVEQACWMSGRRLDLPELGDFGIEPHAVAEKYYCARGPHLVNRVVDISPVIETKLKAVASNRTPIENMFNAYKRGGGTIATVEEYIRNHIVGKAGRAYPDLEYAEEFHYIGPEL